MEMSVWEIPGNVSHKKEYPDMVRACVNLWKEHQLGKNATPEVFFFPLQHPSIFLSFLTAGLSSGPRTLARTKNL